MCERQVSPIMRNFEGNYKGRGIYVALAPCDRLLVTKCCLWEDIFCKGELFGNTIREWKPTVDRGFLLFRPPSVVWHASTHCSPGWFFMRLCCSITKARRFSNSCAWESPGVLVSIAIAGPLPQGLRFRGLGWSPGLAFLNKCPGDAVASDWIMSKQ